MAVTKITGAGLGLPNADGNALGGTSNEWSDLYLADGGVIYLGNDQDVTLTHVADTGILLNSTMAIQFNDASQYINAPSNAILDINATDEIELNATLLDVNANLDVSGTIVGASTLSATTITASTAVVPDASDGATIGTAALEWSDLYIADGGVIYFGDDQDVTLTHVADTAIQVNKDVHAESFNLPITLNGTDGSSTHAGDNIILDASAAGTDVGERLLYEGIPPNEVSVANLAAGTDGHIITFNADGYPTTVGPGTDGQVLTSTGAGKPPEFEDAAGGAWSLIASSTYPAAVTWTLQGMDSTYDVYCFSFSGVTIANDNNSIFLRVGDSGGIKSDSKYHINISKHGNIAAQHDAGTGQDMDKAGPMFNDAGNASGENGSGVLWIHRTGNNCNINGTITYQSASNEIRTGYAGIWYDDSSFDITQIQLLSTTGNFTSGRISLWGVSHA